MFSKQILERTSLDVHESISSDVHLGRRGNAELGVEIHAGLEHLGQIHGSFMWRAKKETGVGFGPVA